MVMQNGLLSRIALSRPSSFAELARIKGMGDSRAEKYGPEILRIISESLYSAGVQGKSIHGTSRNQS